MALWCPDCALREHQPSLSQSPTACQELFPFLGSFPGSKGMSSAGHLLWHAQMLSGPLSLHSGPGPCPNLCPEGSSEELIVRLALADRRQIAQEPHSDPHLPSQPSYRLRRCFGTTQGSDGQLLTDLTLGQRSSQASTSRGPSPRQLLFLLREQGMAGPPHRAPAGCSVAKRVLC